MKYISYDEFLQNLKSAIPTLKKHPLDVALEQPMKDGLIIECGVYKGDSITKIANSTKIKVYGFDSFEGLPENWDRSDMKFEKGHFSLGKNLPKVPQNVELIQGWFDDTLPQFVENHQDEKIGFLHVDCDLYSSTKTIFDVLGDKLQDGTIIVFDELLNYPNYDKNEIKAFYEYLINSKFNVRWLGKVGAVDLNPIRDNGYNDQPVACVLIEE